MKSTFKLLLAGLLLTGFTACEGNSDDGETPSGSNGAIEAPYTLSVVKDQIEADGKDEAKFVLKDANGNTLTDGEQINYISFENVATGNFLEKKSTGFTAVKNGSYEFKAYYKGKPSENTVTITAKNRAKYEKYFRKVAVYDITNVHCGFCPMMAAALEETPIEWRKHLTIFGIHGPFDNRDPYIINGVADNLLANFVGSGLYPSCIFNLNYTMKGAADAKPSFIAKVIEDQLRNYPATCGIRINSSYADGAINVEAGLTSSVGGVYDLGYALIKDGAIYVGGTDSDNRYDDVVMAISGNYMLTSAEEFTAEKDVEQTRPFNMEVEIAEENLPDFRIAVFALRTVDNQTIIDNVAECKLGENIGYVTNE